MSLRGAAWAQLRRLQRRADRRARTRFVSRAPRHTQYVSVESEGRTFLVPTTDRKLGQFFTKRTRPELRVLDSALAALHDAGVAVARTTFVDAGANIGTATFAALNAGFAAVVACEPEPENARLLRANVALNGAHDSVHVLELALSDRPGTATLDLGPGSRGKSRVLAESEDEAKGSTVEVTLARLDDLVDPAAVGFLWLDVEGHEAHVLAGAPNVLAGAPPLVLELYPRLLARAGRLDALPGLLGPHYSHVLDLRADGSRPAPIETLPELVEHYADGHTDVLVYR